MKKSFFVLLLGATLTLTGCDFSSFIGGGTNETLELSNYTNEVEVGSTYVFDGIATLKYKDQSQEDKEVQNDQNFTYTLDTSVVGTQKLNAQYVDGTKTIKTSANILVYSKLAYISLTEYSTQWAVGTEYEYDGKVIAYYENNSSKEINDGYSVRNAIDVSKEGSRVVYIDYTEHNIKKSAYFTLIVKPVKVEGISFKESSKDLYPGDKFTLTPVFNPVNSTNKNITWSSNNSTVASVSNGVVTANAVGSAKITAKTADGGYTAVATINVNPRPVTGVKLGTHAFELKVGKTSALTATVEPSNATNKNVTWISSDDSVATVTSAGVVKGIGAGTATITVKTIDREFTDSCVVTVKTVAVTGVNISNTSATVNVGSTLTLSVTVLPDDATNKEVNWSSSDESIATVTKGNNGSYIVNGISQGNAVITVRTVDGNFTKTCDVEVKSVPVTSITLSKTDLSVTVGETANLTANVLPNNATIKDVTWSSLNPAVATVTNGTVKGISNGETTITVTSVSNPTVKANCDVLVSDKSAWTIMIYMCGSNLEYAASNSVPGYGSADLKEILSAGIPQNPTKLTDKINIIVQTGGIKTDGRWALSSTYLDGATSISAAKTQRWEVRGSKLHLVQTNNTSTLSTQSELTNFLKWGLDNYPAQRYGVIMWDHGAGIAGCLSDEASNKTLSNPSIAKASEAALSGRTFDKFDFIAYDCCLMGCADIASVNQYYYKYMVGSQETEYAGGYDYDAWLKALKNNPTGMTTDGLCDKIAQTFLQEQCFDYRNCGYCYQTSAVYDLSKMPKLVTDFNSFAKSLAINTQSRFNQMCTNVFEQALSFGEDDEDGSLYGLCDFSDLVTRLGNYYAKETEATTVVNDVKYIVTHNYYCAQYRTKPCGMNAFVAHAFNNSYYPMQVAKSDYTGSYASAFTNWQNMNLTYGEYY